MIHHINQKVLITTSSWFIAPDGKEYRAVWGELKAIHEAGKALGFIPNRAHANWFIEVGSMIIMGCQVMYVTACPDKPDFKTVEHWTANSETGVVATHQVPTKIYIAE